MCDVSALTCCECVWVYVPACFEQTKSIENIKWRNTVAINKTNNYYLTWNPCIVIWIITTTPPSSTPTTLVAFRVTNSSSRQFNAYPLKLLTQSIILARNPGNLLILGIHSTLIGSLLSKNRIINKLFTVKITIDVYLFVLQLIYIRNSIFNVKMNGNKRKILTKKHVFVNYVKKCIILRK